MFSSLQNLLSGLHALNKPWVVTLEFLTCKIRSILESTKFTPNNRLSAHFWYNWLNHRDKGIYFHPSFSCFQSVYKEFRKKKNWVLNLVFHSKIKKVNENIIFNRWLKKALYVGPRGLGKRTQIGLLTFLLSFFIIPRSPEDLDEQQNIENFRTGTLQS